MSNLTLQPRAAQAEPLDLAAEVARLELLLAERRRELAALREELHEFKARYTQVVGSRLSELAELERAIREAEERALGLETDEAQADEAEHSQESAQQVAPVKKSLRKLFWSVARLFHPDHAADEREAERRHAIMAEASRAYREGDVESLRTLLGDEELQSYCAGGRADEDPQDLPVRLLNLKEELRTVEFGLRRIRQDGMYRVKLKADEEAAHGRDALAAMAERVGRQITKARHRLAHLGVS